uniref:DDE-1 domain-containing protein n=1 Tax=Panagrolaimus sp. PS1159 TaxID=55785 RepID=A0AC35GVL8_9BILA
MEEHLFGKFAANPHTSKLRRRKDGDTIFRAEKEISEAMYWPVRACGDIPFKNYRLMHMSSPEKYLHFLKELEISHSRHDFLFWVFDIITAGRNRKNFHITNVILDNASAHYMKNIHNTINSCIKGCNKLSEYLVKTYPYLFDCRAAQFIKKGNSFNLTTYQSYDEKLWNYRKYNLEKLVHHVYRFVNNNYVFFINPMENLICENFPLPELQVKPEDREYPEYIKSLEYQYEDHDLSPAFSYFFEVFTLIDTIPDRNEVILINRNPYKQKQIECLMRKIDSQKLIDVSEKDALKLAQNETIILALIPDSDLLYERAQILLSDDFGTNVRVFCVDSGKYLKIPIRNTYAYDFGNFKLTSFREAVVNQQEKHAKNKVVTLAERIPRNKLPLNDLRIGDFFVYDNGFTTDKIPKYIPFGRPQKPKTFFSGRDSVR